MRSTAYAPIRYVLTRACRLRLGDTKVQMPLLSRGRTVRQFSGLSSRSFLRDPTQRYVCSTAQEKYRHASPIIVQWHGGADQHEFASFFKQVAGLRVSGICTLLLNLHSSSLACSFYHYLRAQRSAFRPDTTRAWCTQDD
jgi:hypothetical protein